MPHFRENKFSCGLYRKRFKGIFFRVNFLEIKTTTVLFFKSKNDFAFKEFLSKVFQFIIKLISLKFKEIICIVENNDHHFVFNLVKLYFSVIVKFSNFIKLVSENIFVSDTIKINIKVQLENSSFY